MKQTLSVQSANKRLGHLDALRGIAILGVILVHSAILTRQVGPTFGIAFTGQRGVQLFYMISAFTLALSLDSERREQHPLSNYFIRRFFRIAPLFYLVIVCNLALESIAPSYSSLHRLKCGEVLLGFFFLNGISPKAINSVVAGGWSIAVETTFYLCLPLLRGYFNTVSRTLILFLLSAPALESLSYYLARHAAPRNEQFFAFLWFPVEFPVFVLGLLTYYIWKEQLELLRDNPIQQKRLSLLLIFSSTILYGANLPFTDSKLYLSSFLFCPLILGLSLYSWPVLVNWFTRLIGKISYSLYLIHFFVLSFLAFVLDRLEQYPGNVVSAHIYHRPLGLVVFFMLALGLSLPLCMLSWKFVEEPGIRMGRRLIRLREGGESKNASPLVPSLRELESSESTRGSQF